MSGRGAIDDYLDAVSKALRVPARERRRALRELRAHLLEAIAHEEGQGKERPEALSAARARTGSPKVVADEFSVLLARPPRRQRLRVASAILALALTASAAAVAASVAIDRPVYALLFDQPQQRSATSPSRGIVATPPAATLVRLNPRTLRPLPGRRLRLGSGIGRFTRSPDGTRAVLVGYSDALLRFVDLRVPRLEGHLRLARGADASVRGFAWPRRDRLLVAVQRYARHVTSRTLLVIDPLARRVLSRRPLARERIDFFAAVGEERVVAVMSDSNWRRPWVRLVVADVDGNLRSATVTVGTWPRGRGRKRVVAVAEPTRDRVLLVVEDGRVIEVGLGSLRSREHRLELPARPGPGPSIIVFGAASAGDDQIAASGFRRTARFQPGNPFGGIWLVNTHNWRARLLERRGTHFQHVEGRLLTYGSGFLRVLPGGRVRSVGPGITVYGEDGKRLYGLYPGKRIQNLLVLDGFLHTLVYEQRLQGRPRAVFDLATGRNLGRISRPPPRLLLLRDRGAG